VFAKSIDLGIMTISANLRSLDGSDARDVRTEQETTSRLLELFTANQIAATWTLAEPDDRARIEELTSAITPQEIALVAEADWASPQASRRVFGSELSRRLERAHKYGYAVRTLALSGSREIGQPDLALKHGITAVRTERPTISMRRWLAWSRSAAEPSVSAPRAVCYGLWELPVTTRVPADKSSSTVSLSRAVRHALDGGYVHIMIDVARLAAQRRVLRTLEVTIGQARQQQQQHTLAVLPLGEASARLVPARQSRPAQSILREAA